MKHRDGGIVADRRRVALFAAIVVAVVAAAVGASVMLLRRHEMGPGQAAEAWLLAARADDEQALRDLTCAAKAGVLDIDGEQSQSVSWSISAEAANAETATVTADVTYTVEGFLQHDTWTVDLVREADAWKLCSLRSALTEPDTPRTALAGWMTAALANDLPTVHALTCAAEADGITADEIAGAIQEGLTYEISDVARLDESTAQVAFTVQVQRNGGPVSFDERWIFVHEDDAWKACGPARS